MSSAIKVLLATSAVIPQSSFGTIRNSKRQPRVAGDSAYSAGKTIRESNQVHAQKKFTYCSTLPQLWTLIIFFFVLTLL